LSGENDPQRGFGYAFGPFSPSALPLEIMAQIHGEILSETAPKVLISR